MIISRRRHWLLGPTPQIILAAIALAAAYQVVVLAGAKLPHIRTSAPVAKVAGDASLALLSSWVFNLLAIVLPGYRKRIWIRDWLDGRYLDFKRSLINIYLSIVGRDRDDEDVEQLLDASRFSDFCSDAHSLNQSNWHAVHNGLYEWGLPQIRDRCEVFLSECELAVNLVGELGEESAKLMNRVRNLAFQARSAEPEYDSVKNLLNSLFALHCPWAVLDGEKFEDRPRQHIECI